MIELRPYIVDLKVAVLGIRSLVQATENAEMEISLTNSEHLHGITVQEAFKKIANKKSKKGEDDEDTEEKEQDHDEIDLIGANNKRIQMEGVQYLHDGSVRI